MSGNEWSVIQMKFFRVPGTAAATFSSDVVDHKLIDGSVVGVGTLVRASGTRLRRLQTGYIRNYALGIAAGAVLLLAFFVSRGALR